MWNKLSNIKIISYGLAVLYALSFVACVRFFVVSVHPTHALILAIIFGVLFGACLGLARFEEKPRVAIVALNGILVFYILVLNINNIEIIPIGYVFLCIAITLFFNQTKVKVSFKGSEAFERKSVLLIDDDPSLVKAIKPVLLSKGYSVLTANTGEKGLQIARMQKPDIILLDVILPGVKGREVCAKLKDDENTKNIPVLFLTAKDSPDDIEAEKAAGALSHITKPFNRNELLSEVKKAIDTVES